MKFKYIFLLFLSLSFFQTPISAQTLEQAKQLFLKKEYGKAKPAFFKFVKSQPNNGSYNYWYGVCCYETGEKEKSEKYLLVGANKKVQEAFRYLGQLYFDLYRFEESEKYYDEYITILEKAKKSVSKYEPLLNQARLGARMLKGVEEVIFVDSFVVDKKNFLEAYRISEEAGQISTFREYFNSKLVHPGTVYQTELKNKLYYGDRNKENKMDIFTRSRQLDDWGKPIPLPESINTSANENYPYVLSDGVTIYYASDGEGSLGGYDIFVTRYNTNTDNYLVPDNVGMPFNSPYNDYMYVIDEYNNLGWFASDRYQPEDKVCVYVFIPNTSKKIYNYETTDIDVIRNAARLASIEMNQSNNAEEVKAAKQRLTLTKYNQPQTKDNHDFTFIVDDNTIYYMIDDFKSPFAKSKFKNWQQKQKDYQKISELLEKQRDTFSSAKPDSRKNMAPGLLDLEKRVEQMEREIIELERDIRNEEIKKLSK